MTEDFIEETGMEEEEDEDEDDEVVRELDVWSCGALELYLLQYPLRPVFTDHFETVKSTKFKPIHKKLELEVPYPAHLVSRASGDDTCQKIAASSVAQNISLGAGVIRDNALHITAVKEVFQMRPSFKDLKIGGDIIEGDFIDDEEDIKDEKPALQQVHMKRKETERAQTNRINSYGYLHAQEESEPWIPLRFHDFESQESIDTFEKMYVDANPDAMQDS